MFYYNANGEVSMYDLDGDFFVKYTVPVGEYGFYMRFENKLKVRVSLDAPDTSIDYVNSIIRS